MSEKRYFKVEYDEEWYLFDSTTISEQLVKEQAEYGYGVFANSLSPSEICDRLNNLHQENQQLQKEVKDWKFINDFQEKEIDGLEELLKEKEYVEEVNKHLQKKIDYLCEKYGYGDEND